MTEKYYAFYEEHNGERFYFENGEECVVVVKAKSADEAWEQFLGLVDSDYENEAKNQIIEEFDNPLDFDFCDYVEWNIDLFPHYESEPQKRPW